MTDNGKCHVFITSVIWPDDRRETRVRIMYPGWLKNPEEKISHHVFINDQVETTEEKARALGDALKAIFTP